MKPLPLFTNPSDNHPTLFRRIIRIIWFSELGRGKVLGRFATIAIEMTTIMTFLKVYGFHVSLYAMGIFAVCWFVLGMGLGYFYARFNLLKFETDLTNEHNPMLKELYDRVVKMEEAMSIHPRKIEEKGKG